MNKITSIEAFLNTLTPMQTELVLSLRKIIKAAVPEATESIKWGIPYFECDGLLCYLAPHEQRINLGFAFGASLPNAGRLLQGNGTVVRHLYIEPTTDIDMTAIQTLLKEAVAFNKSKL